MKLLTMPNRVATTEQVVPQIWATEGNLATAVAVMHAPEAVAQPSLSVVPSPLPVVQATAEGEIGRSVV